MSKPPPSQESFTNFAQDSILQVRDNPENLVHDDATLARDSNRRFRSPPWATTGTGYDVQTARPQTATERHQLRNALRGLLNIGRIRAPPWLGSSLCGLSSRPLSDPARVPQHPWPQAQA